MNFTPKLKICGMTCQTDLQAASDLGYDYCGFIFHKGSKRYIEPEKAIHLDSGNMVRVGVFVSTPVKEIIDIMLQSHLDLAQLHGDYSENDARLIGGKNVIRVIWPDRFDSYESLNKQIEKFASCAFFLVEKGMQGGGSGQKHNLAGLINLKLPKPWFLAGGLNPDNVEYFNCSCHPYALDLNSGLEDAPGKKNHKLMKKVIEMLRKEHA